MGDKISEKRFQRLVAGWLAESFAEVEAEVTLSSGRRPDFIAYTPFDSYVIEVENGWDSIKDGLGQAAIYSAESGHEPVLVFPADEVDSEEFAMLRAAEGTPHIETI